MRDIVDLNCDMGEGFGHWTYGEAPDEDLMALISSANVAAGFHAGDPNSIDRVARLAASYGVGLGAHPAYDDLRGFGRRFIDASPEELVNDVLYQIGAVREFGRRHGIPLQHVKPHGALYMEAARNETLSAQLVQALIALNGDLILFCMGMSKTYDIARAAGLTTVREFFADRDYGDDGSIIFKRTVQRSDPEAIADKCLRACKEGTVVTDTGNVIEVAFESICFHSDTPGALDNGRAIKARLEANNIRIAPAAEVLARMR
ncbi:5-oxoprolinase subunit PxpA [Loktanella sp. M215]|uniref:5-oxoprolinase subunit PxpA n=1 Tax=Loktanella sp. M215 TaxID=2675431 RepID=UPI001F1598FA|nr:5-oxoprolinase subunit PxpA [Loktanella sp. M215]MBU2360316.1 5-oxoprolinase subunit PxpA [Alphaproteobacteria bacterium]MCF7701075.1 5-oxoprolinase subunit PxpA [Loktanella sp. M215]